MAWDNFLKTYLLDMEVTTLKLNRKSHLYIRCGSWNDRHPPRTPQVIFKAASASTKYSVPKLHISTVAIHFAVSIGVLFTPENVREATARSTASLSRSSENSLSEFESEDEKSSSDSDSACTASNIFDPKDYPILHQLRLNSFDKLVQNQLIHELLKFNGGSFMQYTQKSNHRRALVCIPSMKSSM
jgi:hypothetical protein